MATHKDFKTFAVKYNKEFEIAGIHKMKKAELIKAIEDKLKKSRKEIRDEYKQLKNMVKVTKPKTTTVTKPKTTTVTKTKTRKLKYDETTLRKMYPILINAPLSTEAKKFTKAELDIAYTKAEKVLSTVEAGKWKEAYEDKYKQQEIKKKIRKEIFSKPKTKVKKEPVKKQPVKKEPKKKVVPKKAHNKFMKDLREQPINQTLVDKLDKPNINITKLGGQGFTVIAHYKQDGKKMTPLRIPLNVTNPELLKPEKERKKEEPKKKPAPKKEDEVRPIEKVPRKERQVQLIDAEKILKTKYGEFFAPLTDIKEVLPIMENVMDKLSNYKFNNKNKITENQIFKFYDDSKIPRPSDTGFDDFINDPKINFNNIPNYPTSINFNTTQINTITRRYRNNKFYFGENEVLQGFLLDASLMFLVYKDLYESNNKILKNINNLDIESTKLINGYLYMIDVLSKTKTYKIYLEYLHGKKKNNRKKILNYLKDNNISGSNIIKIDSVLQSKN